MHKAYDEGARYLAARMHTRQETRRHLSQKGFDEEEIREAMDWLSEGGALDDAAYAFAYGRNAIEKGKSSARIRAELKARGVETNDIEAGLCQVLPDADAWASAERERAELLAARILNSQEGPPNPKALAKAGRKLAGLGYPTELIYKILGEYMKGREG